MGDYTWRPRTVEDSVDDGVHPAVAAMRLSGATNAPQLSLGALSRFGLTPSSLAPVEKRPSIQSPTRQPEKKAKKKDKHKKEKKQKRQKKKKKKKGKDASSSSSASGSSPSSSSSSSAGKSKRKKKDSKKEKRKKPEAAGLQQEGGRHEKDEATRAKPELLCSSDEGAAEARAAEAKRRRGAPEETPAAGPGASDVPGTVGDHPGSALLSSEPMDAAEPALETLVPPPQDGASLVVQGIERRDLSVLGKAVELLKRGTADAQEAIASALASLTPNSVDKDGSSKVAVASAGAILPLTALLTTGTPGVQKQVARALHNLTSKNSDNKAAVIEAGAVAPLLALMRASAPTVQQQVVGVLRNLTGGSIENKVAVVRANAIPILASATLLQAATTEVQANIAVILYNLANNNAEHRVAVAEAGGIGPLVKLLANGPPEVQKEAADTLRILTVDEPQLCIAIAAAGVAPAIAAALKSASPRAKRNATMLRDHLAKYGGVGVRAALVSAKALPA